MEMAQILYMICLLKMMVHSYLKLPEGYQQKKYVYGIFTYIYPVGDFLKYPTTHQIGVIFMVQWGKPWRPHQI